MSEFGPKITIKTERSCRGCKALESESYAVQSDTGFYHYCAHSSLPTKVRIPGHGTDTPDWCAALATPAAAAEEDNGLQQLRNLAATCYAGLGAECNLPENWLDALAAAANGEPFSLDGLLPYRATPAAAAEVSEFSEFSYMTAKAPSPESWAEPAAHPEAAASVQGEPSDDDDILGMAYEAFEAFHARRQRHRDARAAKRPMTEGSLIDGLASVFDLFEQYEDFWLHWKDAPSVKQYIAALATPAAAAEVTPEAPKSLLRKPLKAGERLVCYCPPGICQAPKGFSGPCNRAATPAAAAEVSTHAAALHARHEAASKRLVRMGYIWVREDGNWIENPLATPAAAAEPSPDAILEAIDDVLRDMLHPMWLPTDTPVYNKMVAAILALRTAGKP